MNKKHCRNTHGTLTYILQHKYYITNQTGYLHLKLLWKTETVSSCWYFGTQYKGKGKAVPLQAWTAQSVPGS
jgi:hypothetical protein